MASSTPVTYEETLHYNGEASVKFYPGSHFYAVTDEKMGFKSKRMGGATSLTGVMDKGQGLMMWPMYEMKKYLKKYFRTTTIEEMFDSPMSLEDLLKEGTLAHKAKADRGKNVGTDAHAWVETYLKNLQFFQKGEAKEFVVPEIPEVEEIADMLRKSYLAIFNSVKPTNVEEYKSIPRMLFQDAEIQEAIWTEASMRRRSTLAAKEWFENHTIIVHGTEDTVYSRNHLICGKYDADLTVTCSEKCGWCYLNGSEPRVGDPGQPKDKSFQYTGRYITDFKSTNASTDAPKGIYPEYLAQCGSYEMAKTEEFPDIKYDGCLILNGSKDPKTDKEGNEYPVFNSHFSFNNASHVEWAQLLSQIKEKIYNAKQEIKASA